MPSAHQVLTETFRANYGRLLAALLTVCQDMELAEEALQEAFVSATAQWPVEGTPNNPSGWLYQVAKRRLIDAIRKQSVRCREQAQFNITQALYDYGDESEQDYSIPEERLRLIFTCCHPALAMEARVALTLKSICGLSVKEIARAYLCSEDTMARRLSRAKQKIRKAGIQYSVPEDDELLGRLDSVLQVVYLIYNESYTACEGETITRDDLATEAHRLAALLYELLPSSQCGGLLALILFHEARRPARKQHNNVYISLEKQDRSLWNQAYIESGNELLNQLVGSQKVCGYIIQAAISALHCNAQAWSDTDWKQIALLYWRLSIIEPSPVVELNYAVAVFYDGRPKQALGILNKLQEPLQNYPAFYVTSAVVSASLGNFKLAEQAYEKAISLTVNFVEKEYLEDCLSKLRQEFSQEIR
jgi:RNA polymerase sigma-70 factor (ECF subfamily)